MRAFISLITVLILLAGNTLAIPWPVGDVQGEQDVTHTLMRGYGGYHIPWSNSCQDSVNFHFGVDFDYMDPVDGSEESENVWSVEAGVVTFAYQELHTDGNGQEVEEWVIVVCETSESEEGWCYQHIEPLEGSSDWIIGDEIEFGTDRMATMAELQNPPVEEIKHLHLMRSLAEYQSTDPGLLNPLYHLSPEPSTANGFTWWFSMEGVDDRYFFLPDVDAVDPQNPQGGWLDEWPTVEDAKDSMYYDEFGGDGIVDVYDDVDFFGYVLGGAVGEEGGDAQFPAMPTLLEWTLYRWDGSQEDWTAVQEPDDSDFTRYVLEFGDFPMGGSSDWQKYKQLYFCYQPNQLWNKAGRSVCLTNCSAAQDYAGIDNIEESCWQTALEVEGQNPSYHPDNMLTPDGSYRITMRVFDWEDSPNPDPQNPSAYNDLDFMLHNSREIADEVRISDSATDEDIWHAEWVAEYTLDGFEPVKEVYTNAGADPGVTLDIEIIFSGPMKTDVDPYVRFEKANGEQLVAQPATPEWTSTAQPPGYYDTWHGTVEVPSSGMSGWLEMKIKAKDYSDLGLLDPSDPNPGLPASDSYRDYTDTHHGFGIAFGPEAGWPAAISDQCYGSPCLADVDGDGDLDVSVLCNDGYLEVLDDDGSALVGWQSGDWGDTYPSILKSTPAAADIDGDGGLEVLSVLTYGCTARDSYGAVAPGWPVYMEEGSEPGYFPGQTSPSVYDLDGDGELEVVLTRHKHNPLEVEATVFVYDEGGAQEWSSELSGSIDAESVISTPAIGDISLSRDGNELVICTSHYYETCADGSGASVYDSAIYLLGDDGSEIWSTPVDAWFYASPVVGDVDGDGENEIVIGTAGSGGDASRLLILDAAVGTVEQSWTLDGWIVRPIAMGDLDGDGSVDLVVPCNDEYLYAWSGSGYASLAGFPVNIGEQPGAPMLVDIDTDYELEVVFGSDEGNLWALNPDGSVCTGFPLSVGANTKACPAVGDIDGDCRSELVVLDQTSAAVHCYDMGEGSYPVEAPWRQFGHDSWHTGCFAADNTVPAPPTNLTGEVEYTSDGSGIVDLEWTLSVNDMYSSSPQDPADVVCYLVYRGYPPYDPPSVVGRPTAGDSTYTDNFNSHGYPAVMYYVTAFDGTNESEETDSLRYPTTDGINLALGRPVREVFDSGAEAMSIGAASPESAPLERRATADVIAAPSTLDSHLRSGNPACLTDGQTDEVYTPSVGACAVVIDLGGLHEVTDVIVSGGSEAAMHGDGRRRSICLAREAGQYTTLSDDGNAASARYVRVQGVAGAEEILVYGETASPERARLQTSRSSGGWSIRLPAAGRSGESVTVPSPGSTSEEGTLAIYDITGRRVWSTRAEAGSTVSWDGRRDSGSRVPNGVYLLRFQCGSLVSTGRLEVVGASD